MKLNLTKGADLRLKGEIAAPTAEPVVIPAKVLAVIPDDFPGFMPRAVVKPGDTVTAGTALFVDKRHPEIALVSPAAGTVREIVRGERRHILRCVVDVDQSCNKEAPVATAPAGADELRARLMESGLWTMMRQRPFDIVPESDSVPSNILITLLDTAPLAVDPSELLKERMADLEAGVKALGSLTPGKIYVAVRDGAFPPVAGAEMVEVSGPHPAGNAGVIAANIAPVCKGRTIWTLDGFTLAAIGAVASGRIPERMVTVAVTGPEVKQPQLVRTLPGARIETILADNIRNDAARLRVISGNVLTGVNAGIDGWLHYPYRQITVIEEGSDAGEFMGWASMSANKMSNNRSFLSWLMPWRRFAPDARINGGRRAMIMSGVYERMMPMDILPEHLIKAVISRNIEQMEALGIYEVAPEDFALAEWADPSKLELQKIVREGLDYLRNELQ